VNRNRIYVLAFLFLLIFTFPVAPDTVTLTLEDAVKRALDQSINLKKGAIDLSLTQYSANNLWSEIFPGFSVSTGLTVLPKTPLFTDPGFSYNQNGLSYSYDVGISLSLNPSFSSSMKRIELAYRAQLLSYDTACKQLEIQVIKNFLNLVTMKENIATLEQSLKLAEQNLQRDQTARQNGLLSELDWLNSRLSVETARYNLIAAQGSYQNALEDFLALLGMDAGTDINFSGTVEISPVLLDPEQLIREYLPKRPDIVSQRQTIERLVYTKNITTLGARSPSLRIATAWQGTPASGGLTAPFTDNVSGSLTLSIPIDAWIPGTKTSQTLQSASADVDKARLDLQNTETQAKAQIRSLILNLHSTWQSLEIAHLRVEIAQRTVDAAEEGFQNGTVEFQELETLRRDLSNANQQLLQGEYSYQSLLLDLATALNVDWRTLTGQQAGAGQETERSMP